LLEGDGNVPMRVRCAFYSMGWPAGLVSALDATVSTAGALLQ
jgi:hypothetical protein